MPGGVIEHEGPEAAAAVRVWAASLVGKRALGWQTEVEWDAGRRGCVVRFRSGSRLGPADPCFLPAEWLLDPDRRLLCERDLVRAGNRFTAELPKAMPSARQTPEAPGSKRPRTDGAMDVATDTETIRRGLLTFVRRKGGTIPMRELHTHSLVMFQVGHQAFSQVMEGLVADGYVGHDAAARTFHVTASGEQWLETSGDGER